MDISELKNLRKKISNSQKAKLIIYTFLYSNLTILVSYLNRNEIHWFLLGSDLSPSILSGIISSFCVGIGILMTQTQWYIGGIITYILYSLSTLFVFISIFVSHHPESLPGFFFELAGYLIVTVLRQNLKLLDIKNYMTEKLAITDTVTGLYNRRGIQNYIETLVHNNQPFYLLFLDLDNFKTLNDTFGHSSGDLMLKVMADRWLSIPKPDGLIARNGGDEYLIAIPYNFKFDIEGFAQECVKKAFEPVYLEGGKTFTTSASIGIASYPENGTTADELLVKADYAMYESKRKGKNTYTVSK